MRTCEDEADENSKDTFDGYSTCDQPRQKSFYDRYGFDERDGPPEEDEKKKESGYMDDPPDHRR